MCTKGLILRGGIEVGGEGRNRQAQPTVPQLLSSILARIQEVSANSPAPITQVQPMGQSFTPALPTVGFIRLFLENGVPVEPAPITFTLNLRADSITGQILGSSEVTLQPFFAADVDFLFSTLVAVSPGTTYYFQPVVQSDFWAIGIVGDLYSGGTLYSQGSAHPLSDLFFREGIVVPEPSVIGLAATAVALALVRSKKKRLQG